MLSGGRRGLEGEEYQDKERVDVVYDNPHGLPDIFPEVVERSESGGVTHHGTFDSVEDAENAASNLRGKDTHILNITPEMREKSLKGMPISRRQTQRKALLA